MSNQIPHTGYNLLLSPKDSCESTLRKEYRRYLSLWGMAALLVMLSACDRPFVEVSTPGIEIVSPDLSTVFVENNVPFSISARSFRPVKEVRLNGQPMTLDPQRDLWETTVEFERGLNTLVIEAFDVDDVVGVDTAYAVYLPFRFILNAPRMPEPRGGHTATLLSDGSLLLIGGTDRLSGPAHDDAFLLPPNGARFEFLDNTLNVARTGHTATRLPDGRVLILGGSRTNDVASILDLVETVEIFDPETLQFDIVPFESQPIRRTLHTAVLRTVSSSLIIDLYGGRGDIRYGDKPRVGTRRDLRSFELVGDTLVALNTLASAPLLEAAISGHTETSVRVLPAGVLNSYLILGSFFDNLGADEVSFRIDYTESPAILLSDAPPMLTPRTRHAVETLGSGFLVVFGGHQASSSEVLDLTELYNQQADRFFRFPNTSRAVKRFGQNATNLSARRILLTGGFAADGNSLAFSEFFDARMAN